MKKFVCMLACISAFGAECMRNPLNNSASDVRRIPSDIKRVFEKVAAKKSDDRRAQMSDDFKQGIEHSKLKERILREKIDKNKTEAEKLEADAREFEDEADRLERGIKDLREQLDSCEQSGIAEEKISVTEKKISQKTKKIEKYKEFAGKFRKRAENLMDEIASIEAEIEYCGKEIKKYKKYTGELKQEEQDAAELQTAVTSLIELMGSGNNMVVPNSSNAPNFSPIGKPIVHSTPPFLKDADVRVEKGEWIQTFNLQAACENPENPDGFFLPRTEEDLDTVYNLYLVSEDRDMFFSGVFLTLEENLEMLLKSGSQKSVEDYLGQLSTAFYLFSGYEKHRSFAKAFFSEFRDEFSYWVLDMDKQIREEEDNKVKEKTKSFLKFMVWILTTLSDSAKDIIKRNTPEGHRSSCDSLTDC